MIGNWVHKALCGKPEHENVNFFPDTGELGGPGYVNAVRKSQAICLECPVRVECAVYAVRANERIGVWGATTPTERHRLHHARNLSLDVERFHLTLKKSA